MNNIMPINQVERNASQPTDFGGENGYEAGRIVVANRNRWPRRNP
jgi:hypothetical protein